MQNNDNKPITKTSLYSWVFHKNLKLQLVVAAVILVTVAMRVLPLEMQKRIINQAIGMSDLHKLYLYCGLYIGATVLAGVLKYVINLLQNYIGERTLKVIRERLYEHVLSLPVNFYRHTSPGQVISYTITELIPVATFIGAAVAVPMVNVLTFLAMAGYMFYLNPLLGLLSISIYPIEIFVIPQLQKFFNRANRDRIDQNQQVAGLIGESISGVHEVHSNASIPLESNKFRDVIERLYHATLRMNAFKFGIKFVNNFFQSLGPFILFLVGGYLAIKGRFDLGALVAFLSAYEKLYDPWRELMDFWQNYIDSSVRYRQVMDGFDIAPEHELVCKGREPVTMTGDISIQDLTFEVGGGIRLLDKVNVQIQPGEHVALVGFSGSGKSTLALCIAQLYRYTGGSVKIDGFEVNDLTKQDMARNVGMVAQQPFIFSGTVRDNLLYTCEALALQGGSCTGDNAEPSLDKVIEVVQQVGLFLDVLSFGLRFTLDQDKHAHLVEAIIHAREEFRESHAEDLKDDVEFFETDKYSRYLSAGANVVWGAPNKPEWRTEELYRNEIFVRFLEGRGLREPLEAFGAEIVTATIAEIGPDVEHPDQLARTPVTYEEYDTVRRIAAKIDQGRDLSDEARTTLLRLGLIMVAGVHTIAELSDELADTLVAAREPFMQMMHGFDPDALDFLDPANYVHTRSIQDNIIFGRVKGGKRGEERINERIMQLLIMEGVLEQVVEMGLDFEVGSMGDRLSGGQRQKIALARTFLKSPPIMILDEATAALDNASQARVQNLLTNKYRGRNTLVAVIHRLDLLKHYDKVVVLKAGRVVEQGGYQELLDREGALHQLVYGKK
ncbi:ABC transporter transmembrane domain-containing protein [Salidesulfovibrio brasiliensis]|uniref:ABC transporter ATP-binding protein n=1 Tax=Salidesulfovibrio brasiliensis TaxID=221711 RepID=UPI0006D030B3|nr:ABC transporter ATP-binding protein [Salidesulfovibrio brasiliensis]